VLLWRQKSATIHRKMPMLGRQLPITESAHKAGVVGDPSVAAIHTTFDMAAESSRAALLNRRHDLELAKADMPGIGSAPGRPMAMEDVCDLQL
jgi:hypothetical protein